MPQIRNTQLLAQVETLPSTEAGTFVAADFVDALSAEWSQTRSTVERLPASPYFSREVEGIGRGQAQVSASIDVRGSGSAGTAPQYSSLLEACMMQRATVSTINTSATSQILYVGDVLTGGTSGARAVVMKNHAAGVTAITVWLEGTPAFSAAETLNSAHYGASIGTTGGTPTASGTGYTWNTTSTKAFTFATTASWSGSALDGDTVKVVVAGVVVGALQLVGAPSGTTTTAEWIFGTLPASASLTSSSGGTATVAGSPAIVQTIGKTLTMRHNRGKLARNLVGSRGTWTMTADAGSTGRMAFNFTGKPGTVSDTGFVTGITIPSTVPPRLSGGYVVIDGVLIPVKSVEFTIGNTVVMRSDANSSEGDIGAEITGRDPRCTIQIDQVGKVAMDLWSKWGNRTTQTIGAQFGTSAGNLFSFCAPRGQILEISDGDQDGVATHTVSWRLTKIDADADDELVIAHI